MSSPLFVVSDPIPTKISAVIAKARADPDNPKDWGSAEVSGYMYYVQKSGLLTRQRDDLIYQRTQSITSGNQNYLNLLSERIACINTELTALPTNGFYYSRHGNKLTKHLFDSDFITAMTEPYDVLYYTEPDYQNCIQ